MKTSFFLLCFIVGFSSTVLACHPSCSSCFPSTSICQSCVDANSQFDQLQRSCPCNVGYYTDTVSPTFQCVQYLDQNNGISQQMNACYMEIGSKTKDIQIVINSYYDVIDLQTTIHNTFSLNFASISINQACISDFVTKLQYKSNDVWIDVPDSHYTTVADSSFELHYNIIDFYSISVAYFFNQQQFLHICEFRAQIGHADNYVRDHTWQVHVYTNREEIEVISINIDIQESDSCDDCIIVVDLDTTSMICSDSSCTSPKLDKTYVVGDLLYAEIKFKDPTYLQQLEFVSLIYKNDKGQIFNFSSITQSIWINNSLRLQVQLVDPSISALIQVKMHISPLSSKRNLQSANLDSSSSITSVQVNANVLSKEEITNNQLTCANAIIFSFIPIFITLFLL